MSILYCQNPGILHHLSYKSWLYNFESTLALSFFDSGSIRWRSGKLGGTREGWHQGSVVSCSERVFFNLAESGTYVQKSRN